MKALITGANGFVGTYLCDLLLTKGRSVVGISRSGTANLSGDIKYMACDIRDTQCLEKIIRSEKPDEVYHLAGTSYIPDSFRDPLLSYNTIVDGTLNLLEVIRGLKKRPKILFVGSGEVYGEGVARAFSEKDLLRPSSPYAAAKACADLICEQYVKSFDLRIVRARPFNHTGPGQSSLYVCSSFARQISEMEANLLDFISVGNIKVKRDFLDVRDVVTAYYLLMEHGVPGEAYNISSNDPISISEILESLFSHSVLQNPRIVVDSQKVRTNEGNVRFGDNSKLIGQTQWSSKFVLNQTMKDLLDYWRNIKEHV
ncbi:GDP-mannose 4,6-dehydratase [Paenibacillus sp. NPDC058177]|uniref:GDP-mannose 4,6-dehydratase n=1 Tax=Paenibacillus sp. NPDC058177 TaxID=3346369 RepID=UPI0036DCE86D